MGHKADKSFFDEKKPWSKRKDLILKHYLGPYLAKVSKLRHPILLVDGFAGPGAFGDGSPGSPLIICQRAREAIHRGAEVRVLCIETRRDLHKSLVENVRPYEFAEARLGQFLDFVPEVEVLARSHTVFLYIDPYAVEGLAWEGLDRVFRHIQESRMSVEVLLNFHAKAFARRARAALKKPPPPDDDSDSDDLSELLDTSASAVDRLDHVVGGNWWHAVFEGQMEFSEEVRQVVLRFCDKLRERFQEVCHHAIKEKWYHTTPKYVLVFGSRLEDALRLMNDAAVRSQQMFAEAEKPPQPTLFEMRPEEIVPDLANLSNIVLTCCDKPMPRGELVLKVMRCAFGDFLESQIRRCIGKLITSGPMRSATGKPRMKDNVLVWKASAM